MKIHKIQQTTGKFNINNIVLSYYSNDELLNNNSFISFSIAKYVNLTKQKIEENLDNWEFFKKITNVYEHVHTPIYNTTKMAVSKIKPISRAFFKLIEIYNLINLSKTGQIKTFHLAEGPGGFIEATGYYRNNEADNYYGITLIDEDNKSIPGWNKSGHFMSKYKNIEIVYGIDGKGDLFNPNNFKLCNEKYSNKMDVVTADGGFDFSINFNNQEMSASRLIITEVFYALMLQKKGGVFILKIFDTFLKSSIDIIYLLNHFYDEVLVVKPETSRSANSEKYLIAKGFQGLNDTRDVNKLYDLLIEMENNSNKVIKSLVNVNFLYSFLNNIEELNLIIANEQIININNTIKLIKNKERKTEKIVEMREKNLFSCLNWCIKNDIPYNKDIVKIKKEQSECNLFISKG